jgi:hypothetical protein
MNQLDLSPTEVSNEVPQRTALKHESDWAAFARSDAMEKTQARLKSLFGPGRPWDGD